MSVSAWSQACASRLKIDLPLRIRQANQADNDAHAVRQKSWQLHARKRHEMFGYEEKSTINSSRPQ
jgi:hypothetical protein